MFKSGKQKSEKPSIVSSAVQPLSSLLSDGFLEITPGKQVKI
jgi:hypothetical protein